MTDNNNKFILMGLDDAGDVAEALKNPTCKKILDFLADRKEASEKDIADGLNIPINTAEYNLRKLIKARLVDKTGNFFWSVKGKKIPMYKLAKKHIIISPNKAPSLSYLKSILPVILIAAVALLIIGVSLFPKNNLVADSDQLKQFASQQELNNFIKMNSDASGQYQNFGFGRNELLLDGGIAQPAMAELSKSSADSTGSSGASSFSTTNIQIEGVDEADIVKNDGKYIYVVNGNKVKIVEAYPAETMNILGEIDFSDSNVNVGNIFINGDKLIIFANGYNSVPYAKIGIASESLSMSCSGCGGYSESVSFVYTYDVSDRKNPLLENNLSIEGNYMDSRMIGDYVYMVSTKYANLDSPEPPIYYANGIETKISASEIYYWPHQDISYVFTSITALDLSNGEFDSQVYLTGSTNTIFVSQDNIYLTYQKTTDYIIYAEKIAEEVYYPLLSDEYDDKIKTILDSDENNWEKLSEMKKIINIYSSGLSGDDLSDFSKELNDKLEEFNIQIQKETEKTVVHKIKVDKNNIDYLDAGEVPGRILNQFSMDEYNNYFRIATTTGNWGETSLNHLYILDKDLKIVGSVEDLAPGEKIYSARFMGDRAYIVTFKNVDPLYVLDLKNPENPKVLGYLKIPGYSDYLHPYDQDHVIGIGKDVNESIDADKVHSSNAVYYTAVLGLKISLFDVSDVEHPIEESKFVVGDRGTYSPALDDHKAFLFDKEKNLLVLPISVNELRKTTNRWGEYDDSVVVFNGAYVFNINLEEGINLMGKITHFDNQSKYGPAKDESIGTKREIYGQDYVKIAQDSWEIKENYQDQYSKTVYTDEYIDQQPGGVSYNNFYDYQYQIQRSLYLDNVLYTISQSKIKANSLENIREINSLDLNYSESFYPVLYD